MNIKKLFSIFASIAMVLSLIALPVKVDAKENSDQLTRVAENEPFETFEFHYDAVKNDLILTVVENKVWFVNNTIETVEFNIDNGGGSRSIAYNEFTPTNDGKMTATISFDAVAGINYCISRLDVQYKSNGITNFWQVDVNYYFSKPHKLIPAEINALESFSLNGLVESYNQEKVVFNMTMDETVVPNIRLYYRNKNSGKNETTYFKDLNFSRKIAENKYEFTMMLGFEELFEGFENFELVALVLEQNYDEDLTKYSPRYYSTTEIDLNDGYVDVDGDERNRFEVDNLNYKQIESLKSLSFAVKEYYDETQAPEIDFSTFEWEADQIVTPASPKYTFNVKEEGCGVSETVLVFEIQKNNGEKYYEFNSRPSNVEYMPSWIVNGSEIEFAGRYNSLFAADLDGTVKLVAAAIQDNRYNGRIYIAKGYEDDFAYEDSDYYTELHSGFEVDGFEFIPEGDYDLEYKSAMHIDKAIRYFVSDDETGEINYDGFVKEFKNLIKDDTDDGKTYLVDCNSGAIIPDEIFKIIQGKDLNVMFETRQLYAIQWIINGKDIQDSYFEKSEDDDNVVDMNTIAYLYNSGITIKDEEVYMSPDIQCGILDTPLDLSMIDFSLRNESMEKYNNGILNSLKNNSYVKKTLEKSYGLKSEEVFAYYIEYLEKFDIKTEDYEKLFWEEYNRNLTYRNKFYNNGVLPGEFTIRIQEGNMQKSLEKVDCYYEEKDGKQTLVQSGIALTNGYYDLKISHNSTYVLKGTQQEAPIVPPVDTETPPVVDPGTPPTTDPIVPPVDNGNNEQNTQPTNPGDTVDTSANFNSYFYLSCMMFALLGIVVSKKRKVNE